ncbi:hypothetical protein QBC38DRAFT_410676 [Podospora fimiseda]|uniref:Uncharacterized protein n=1 Tax=Podospora fimiseda TaxID=252190 RepID=A0AAN7H3R2_9PEZI|nr:hypothetical protein QBC38DRAFT_410676 [Podospora fimiseda]
MAQSPPPEQQSGKQLHDVPGSGTGIGESMSKVDENKKGLEKLTSNPKGPLDDEVTKKFAKTIKTSNEDKADK